MSVIAGSARATSERRSSPNRRVRRVSLYYPERRSGFERRVPVAGSVRRTYKRMLDAYRRRPGALAIVLAVVVALNVTDLLLTLQALGLGAVEANPLMARLLGLDPVLAAIFKLSVVVAVALVIWAMRRYRRVLEASLLVLGGLTMLLAYHIVGARLLAG